MKAEIGDSIYCQPEGWSGEVMDVVCDDDGNPIGAIVKDHDSTVLLPWICVPFAKYALSEARLN